MEQPHKLRALADWYRGWARVGNDEDRPARLRFAEHLAKRAQELEQDIEHARKHAGGG